MDIGAASLPPNLPQRTHRSDRQKLLCLAPNAVGSHVVSQLRKPASAPPAPRVVPLLNPPFCFPYIYHVQNNALSANDARFTLYRCVNHCINLIVPEVVNLKCLCGANACTDPAAMTLDLVVGNLAMLINIR